MAGVMEPLMLVATALTGGNLLRLTVLTVMWARNYRTCGSEMTAGLVLFGGTMILENLLAIYFFFSSGMRYPDAQSVQQSVATLRAFRPSRWLS